MMRHVKRSQIAKILIPGSYGKRTVASVGRILKAVQVSVGELSPAKEILLKQKALKLIRLERHLQELTEVFMELCQVKIHKNMHILTSMKGIEEKSAMNFLIEMGEDIKQFGSHKKLIAMAAPLPLSINQVRMEKGRSPSEATDLSDE
jgi:transposase